jgi:hypothetical protein
MLRKFKARRERRALLRELLCDYMTPLRRRYVVRRIATLGCQL